MVCNVPRALLMNVCCGVFKATGQVCTIAHSSSALSPRQELLAEILFGCEDGPLRSGA